jgi:hypothetical protein
VGPRKRSKPGPRPGAKAQPTIYLDELTILIFRMTSYPASPLRLADSIVLFPPAGLAIAAVGTAVVALHHPGVLLIRAGT